MTDDCQICFETFNGSTRKRCACSYCAVNYCRECVGTWLTTIVDEPRCPNETCKKAWSREYLDTIMTKVWRDGTYREYREKLLMDRERSMLPATQPRIEAINEAKRLEKEVITQMRDRRKEIQASIRLLQNEEVGIQQQVWDLQNHCQRLREGVTEVATEKQAKTFVRRCPANGCRGFLSTAWKCGVCELYSCNECHEVKGVARDSAHTCDPNNVETAKLLAKDTKPCPKCGEMITKIDGCDQMWCISCHTAFSWRSGQVATGVVHNPHYYEWQRRLNNGEAPRVIGDLPCGGFPEWQDVRASIMKGTTYPGWLSLLELAHRRISHIANVDLMALARDGINVNENIDLRIQYLLKEVDDDTMMSVLIAREKRREKDRELRRVYETLTGAGSDLFRRLIALGQEKGRDDPTIFQPLIKELDELRKFINDALDSLRRRYNATIHGFDDNWERLKLKKNTGTDTATTVKTPYGFFVEAMGNYLTAFDAVEKTFTADQDGTELLQPLHRQLRKIMTMVTKFPASNRTITEAAMRLFHYHEYHLKTYMYASGRRADRWQKDYYERQQQHYIGAPAKWDEMLKTVSLSVEKEQNTIE